MVLDLYIFDFSPGAEVNIPADIADVYLFNHVKLTSAHIMQQFLVVLPPVLIITCMLKETDSNDDVTLASDASAPQ